MCWRLRLYVIHDQARFGMFWMYLIWYLCANVSEQEAISHHNQGFSLEYYGSENAFFLQTKKQNKKQKSTPKSILS